MMLKTIRWCCFIISLFMLASCTGSSTAESPGQFLNSTSLTTKVKASLIDELGSSGFSIQVKTFKDEVQLSGFVNSKEVRQQAAIVAAGVYGVKRVRNAIIIK